MVGSGVGKIMAGLDGAVRGRGGARSMEQGAGGSGEKGAHV